MADNTLQATSYTGTHDLLVEQGRKYPVEFLENQAQEAEETLFSYLHRDSVPEEVAELVNYMLNYERILVKAYAGELNEVDAEYMGEYVPIVAELTGKVKKLLTTE